MTHQQPKEFEAGVFLVDKPAGVSSFHVVSRVRRILNIKKVGHAGTLDPFATGLLVICAGRPATKLISKFMDGEKEYLATLKLGAETTTQDPEGEVTNRRPVGEISAVEIENCLLKYTGRQMQVPPAYSALKHKGKPLYYYARKGIEVKKDAREIKISTLERTDGQHDLSGEEAELGIRVVCGKGTYIRTLGADIGNALGCGAYLVQLRRTRSGSFGVEKSIHWDELSGSDPFNRCINKMITVEQACNVLQ